MTFSLDSDRPRRTVIYSRRPVAMPAAVSRWRPLLWRPLLRNPLLRR
jgi:hypothetical protein